MLRFLWILPVVIVTGLTGYFVGNYHPETALPTPTASVSAEATGTPTPISTATKAKSPATATMSSATPSLSPSPSPTRTQSPTSTTQTPPIPKPTAVATACPTFIAPYSATDARVLSRQFIRGTTAAPIGNGTVVLVDGIGYNYGLGKLVAIRHSNDTVSIYGHLSSILVEVGQKVSVHDAIGRIGMTGRATGPALEILVVNSFCIQEDGTAVFPIGEVGAHMPITRTPEPTPTPTYSDLYCPEIVSIERQFYSVGGPDGEWSEGQPLGFEEYPGYGEAIPRNTYFKADIRIRVHDPQNDTVVFGSAHTARNSDLYPYYGEQTFGYGSGTADNDTPAILYTTSLLGDGETTGSGVGTFPFQINYLDKDNWACSAREQIDPATGRNIDGTLYVSFRPVAPVPSDPPTY